MIVTALDRMNHTTQASNLSPEGRYALFQEDKCFTALNVLFEKKTGTWYVRDERFPEILSPYNDWEDILEAVYDEKIYGATNVCDDLNGKHFPRSNGH